MHKQKHATVHHNKPYRDSSMLQWPFPEGEHRTLPRGRMGVSVYEDEYSSIIAYTLASSEYADFISSSHSRTAPTVQVRHGGIH